MTAIASHRGGAALWPENSMTAFRETARLAVDLVEFDVHQAGDGTVVVHHDATLERTTNGTGTIAEARWPDLRALKLNGTDGERMPLLSEVVALFATTPIDLRLEIKPGPGLQRYGGLEQAAAEILVSHGMLERTIVSSFLLDALLAFRAVAQPGGLIWLVNPNVLASVGGDRVLAMAVGAGIAELGLHCDTIGAREADACRVAGMLLGAYAAHDETAIRHCLDLGLTVLTTDEPVLAIKLRAKSR